MKIKEILAAGRPSVSFEVFPPKKDAPFAPVKEAIERLAKQRPAFMSVTYGASGNAQANTTAIASHVQSCGVTALAHLTCISATREGIAKEAAALRDAGIETFVYTNQSTAVMENLHAFAAQGCTMTGLCTITRQETRWGDEEPTEVMGIRFHVN